MSNPSNLDYTNIDNPYNNNMERTGDSLIGDVEGTVGAGMEMGIGTEEPEIISGQSLGDLWIENWIKSRNYQPKSQGFLLDGKAGYIEANKLYIGSGGIIGGKLDIPDATSANSWHVDTSGNMWFGCNVVDFISDNNNAAAYILKTGVAKFQNVIISGGANVSFISDTLDTSAKNILKDFTFSPSDYSGAFKSGDITWNTTTGAITGGSGIIMYKNGIVGASAGVTTFSIDATTGDAAFSGAITASTVNGSTINIVSDELNFYDESVERCSMGTARDDIYFQLKDDGGTTTHNLYITGVTYTLGAVADSYSEANQTTATALSGGMIAAGQSFTGTADKIYSCKFYLKKTDSPTGDAVAKLYAHSGVFGTSSVPTGSPLATSETYDVSSLTGAYQLITFKFPNGENYQMLNGTNYCIVLEYTPTGGSVNVGIDTTAPSHAGNQMEYFAGWTPLSAIDVCFYVYKAVQVPPAFYSTSASSLGLNTFIWVEGYIRELYLSASTTTRHPLNIPRGLNPTTPVDGDVWYLSNDGLMFYDDTATHSIAMSDGGTGGAGSAGAGNQYIEIEVNGNVYKVLHDGFT